jgi:hypothetical protein
LEQATEKEKWFRDLAGEKNPGRKPGRITYAELRGKATAPLSVRQRAIMPEAVRLLLLACKQNSHGI